MPLFYLPFSFFKLFLPFYQDFLNEFCGELFDMTLPGGILLNIQNMGGGRYKIYQGENAFVTLAEGYHINRNGKRIDRPVYNLRETSGTFSLSEHIPTEIEFKVQNNYLEIKDIKKRRGFSIQVNQEIKNQQREIIIDKNSGELFNLKLSGGILKIQNMRDGRYRISQGENAFVILAEGYHINKNGKRIERPVYNLRETSGTFHMSFEESTVIEFKVLENRLEIKEKKGNQEMQLKPIEMSQDLVVGQAEIKQGNLFLFKKNDKILLDETYGDDFRLDIPGGSSLKIHNMGNGRYKLSQGENAFVILGDGYHINKYGQYIYRPIYNLRSTSSTFDIPKQSDILLAFKVEKNSLSIEIQRGEGSYFIQKF